MRRGAGGPLGVVGVGAGAAAAIGAAGVTAEAVVATGAVGRATGAATTVTGGATNAGRCGAYLAACSACLRSRIAFIASPGFEMFERLNDGLASAGRAVGAGRPPRLKYARTFSASSSSMELECVFFSVTPTASRASRMGLLLTSNSRARSLIRTLLIYPFFVPAVSRQPFFRSTCVTSWS